MEKKCISHLVPGANRFTSPLPYLSFVFPFGCITLEAHGTQFMWSPLLSPLTRLLQMGERENAGP